MRTIDAQLVRTLFGYLQNMTVDTESYPSGLILKLWHELFLGQLLDSELEVGLWGGVAGR